MGSAGERRTFRKTCEPEGTLEKLYNFDNLKSAKLPRLWWS